MTRTFDSTTERFLVREIAKKYGVRTQDLIGDARWQYLDYPRMELIHQLRRHGYLMREIATIIGRTSRGVQFMAARQAPEKPKRPLLCTYEQLIEIHDRYVTDPHFLVEKIGVTSVTWHQIRTKTHWNYAYWIFTGVTTVDEINRIFHWQRQFRVRGVRPKKPPRFYRKVNVDELKEPV